MLPKLDYPTTGSKDSLDGTKISEGTFGHVHRFRNGLIAHMDIQNANASPR
jgi:hypothetical protein